VALVRSRMTVTAELRPTHPFITPHPQS